MSQSRIIKYYKQVNFILLSIVLSSGKNTPIESASNVLDKKWNEIDYTRKGIKTCLPYISLYRNEILFFCKYLKTSGNLFLVIGDTGIELLFGMLDKLNPLFKEKPTLIFPSPKLELILNSTFFGGGYDLLYYIQCNLQIEVYTVE